MKVPYSIDTNGIETENDKYIITLVSHDGSGRIIKITSFTNELKPNEPYQIEIIDQANTETKETQK